MLVDGVGLSTARRYDVFRYEDLPPADIVVTVIIVPLNGQQL